MINRTRFQRARRDFLKLSAAAGGSLVLGCTQEGPTVSSAGTGWRPNAWLEIGSDDIVTIVVAESEMGQGVLTSMSMLVAEELDADWQQVRVRQAPVDPAYGWQGTGGSTSVREGWQPLREAGAAARRMLVAAAARLWKVPQDECIALQGTVVHRASGRRARYGELAGLATRESVPRSVQLKTPADFKLIGTAVPRLDTPAKTNGSAIFGIDVQVPGMRVGAIRHCPFFGGKLANAQSTQTQGKALDVQVVPLESAVVAVAATFWQASRALDRLNVEWTRPAQPVPDSADLQSQMQRAVHQTGERVVERVAEGDATGAVARNVEANYDTPFQAHATMEPMCCTADVRGDRCTLWSPTQQPTGLQRAIARWLTGKQSPSSSELARVTVNTTLLGGGFGRRNLHDFALEAAQASRAVGAPVKLIWSREEDLQHDYYHPATSHWLRAGLDANGKPVFWEHRLAGSTYTDGASELPYRVGRHTLETVQALGGVPTGPWRSVSHAYNAYAVECFIDELAIASGQDPYAYRAGLVTDERLRGVLDLVADKSGWRRARKVGHHLGIAAHRSFGTCVALVVEVSVNRNRMIRVHRVTSAVDCGTVVNPDTVVAQIEGSIAFGLTAALKGQIHIRDGRVTQSNFHDYPLLSLGEMPAVEVWVVPSQEAPGGIGEPAVPPLAPALANAIHAATGKRIRHLPIQASDLSHLRK